jgi:hypothetical protein
LVKPRQMKSGNTVLINPGCHILTMDYVISDDESEAIEVQMKTLDWAGELTELFSRANTEAIHLAIQGLRTKYNEEFNASELFKQLDQSLTTEANWTFTSSDTMIPITLAVFLVGNLIWKKCRQTPELETPLPSAPLMPMSIQNPGLINKATKTNAISISIS